MVARNSRWARALTATVGASVLVLAGCATQPTAPATKAPGASGSAASTGSAAMPTANATAVNCEYTKSAVAPAKPVDPPVANDVPATGTATYTLEMSSGPVTITMDRSKTPCTVNSFDALASQGYFNGTVCHRLVDQGIFILQCGDPTATGRGGPGYSFADELTGKEKYPAGTVAMANAGPNTNGSQFFLVFADSPLPPDYTVFGTMDEASLKTVTDIANKGISRDKSPAPIAPAEIKTVTAG